MSKISDAELEVMVVLWNHSPLSAAAIIEEVQKRKDWSGKTIRTLIDRLKAKEVIRVERNQKELQFSPLIDRYSYEKETRHSLAERLYQGSIGKMLINFVDQEELSEEDLIELRQVLDKMKK